MKTTQRPSDRPAHWPSDRPAHREYSRCSMWPVRHCFKAEKTWIFTVRSKKSVRHRNMRLTRYDVTTGIIRSPLVVTHETHMTFLL